MAFGLTPAAVAEFAAKPFVQKALQQPFSPKSVLSFYLGVDYDSDQAAEMLSTGSFFDEMMPFWYGGHADYDELCKTFAPVIRSIGTLPADPWDTSVDGKFAQLVLCDQLSRNCFRGTKEAFAYDEKGIEFAQSIAKSCVTKEADELPGTFYGTYCTFLVTSMMHSESLSDHELGVEVLEYAKASTPDSMSDQWKNQEEYLANHKAVVDRFGRYPHRNKSLGRESTEEEQAWLDDTENLPGWASSQM